MSILKDLINFTAGVMGLLFEKYEGTLETGSPATGEAPAEVDDLTQIDGIGPTFASRLYAAEVTTFAQLAALSPEQIREITHVTVQADPADWIAEAQRLAESQKLA
jgi:predicted flap endonuclease-1-like 5' DNA nuclease